MTALQFSPEITVSPNLQPQGTAPETIVITVAGILNARHGKDSTAEPAFHPMLGDLSAHGITVEPPLVPAGLGLFGDVQATYGHFSEEVDTILADRGQGARPLYLAHSWGGALALRKYVEDGKAAASDGIITLSSPHRRMHQSRFDPLSIWCKKMGRFSEETLAELEGTHDNTGITLVGSTADHVVPPFSSLPPIAGASRYLITKSMDEVPPVLQGATPVTLPGLSLKHNRLLWHPEMLPVIERWVGQLLQQRPALATAV